MSDLPATRLRYYRKKACFTEAQLAKLIGVRPCDIVFFEVGKAEPTMEQYSRLSHALSVSIDELMVFTP